MNKNKKIGLFIIGIGVLGVSIIIGSLIRRGIKVSGRNNSVSEDIVHDKKTRRIRILNR